MAATEWKAVSWVPNELITDTKLNQMVNNDEYLHNKMMVGRYDANGVTIDSSVRIMTGLALIAAQSKAATASVTVDFSNFFTPGTKPIVTTGIYSQNQRYLMATVQGKGSDPQPDSTGFKVTAAVWTKADKDRHIGSCYVSWAATGY